VLSLYTFLDQLLISYRYSSYCSCCWANLFRKCLRLYRLKLDRDEIWQDCSSSKCTSIGSRIFNLTSHLIKMAAMTSFHGTKCCHLVSEREAYADVIQQCPSVPDL